MVEPSHSGYDGFYRIDKHTSDGWTTLRDWTEHSVSPTHSTLKVVRQGSSIEVYVDGLHVDTVHDSELTGLRRVGVLVNAFNYVSGWVTARFDDFMLTTAANGSQANTTATRDVGGVRSATDYVIELPDTP